ncbi:MAG TPA: glycerate kinase [Victivallales bacterium]|nr:glycerate kinase [Victivallales bacterium]
MKIIIAPNAFKDCLSSPEVADAIESGIKKILPDSVTEKIPVADGGDGLIDVLLDPLNGKIINTCVTGPRFKKINSEFFYSESKHIAVIEMAKASGLALLKNSERDVTQTTSFGTGELIKKAIKLGAEHIYIGIGGSATNDGGMGLANALGIEFYDKNRNRLSPIGNSLNSIDYIDFSNLNGNVKNIKIDIICDVDNPLIGPNGAAHIYGPQKGATKDQIAFLDRGLTNFANVIKKQRDIDITKFPGGGAAGGIGGGLVGMFNASLRPGIEVVLELLNFSGRLQNANLVITAEGQIDNQTIYGKAPAGVAKMAKNKNIPCIAIAGGVGDNVDNLYDIGIKSIFSICPGPVTLDRSIKNGAKYITNITEQIIRTYIL